MIEVNYNDLFHPVESNLLIDLVADRFIEIGEKETVKPLFMDLIGKIEKLTRGIYE